LAVAKDFDPCAVIERVEPLRQVTASGLTAGFFARHRQGDAAWNLKAERSGEQIQTIVFEGKVSRSPF